jgi:hypothetical protein
MRKLVLVVIALLALFALFRAYSDDNGQSTGPAVQPNRLAFLLDGGASIGSPVVIRSPHRGDILSVGGPVTVDSRVEGDVWVLGANVDLSPSAVVTGNLVVMGGKVNASPAAAVGGAVNQLSGLKIRLPQILGTQLSAQALGLASVVLGYALFGFALFLAVFYLAAHARQMQQSLPSLWRQTLITLGLSLVIIPLLAGLVIASVIGVLLLPVIVLAVFLLALDGFLALCVKVGALVRAPGGRGSDQSLYLFTCGLLTLFLVNVPALVGVLLTAFRSATAARVGAVLQALSVWLTLAGLAYGFGAALAHARSRVSGQV